MLDFAREYSIPLALAVLLHAFAAAAPFVFEAESESPIRAPSLELNAISAYFVILEPPTPTAGLPPQRASEPVVSPPSGSESEDTTDESPELEQSEEDRELLRKKALEDLRNQIFSDELILEGQDLITNELGEEGTTYVNAIYSAIAVKWSRPPSATRDMEAVVQVELFPSGELNTASLVQSSGHDAFDKSTLDAVNSVKKFPVPKNSELFERQFRTFKLRFKPEDLLR